MTIGDYFLTVVCVVVGNAICNAIWITAKR